MYAHHVVVESARTIFVSRPGRAERTTKYAWLVAIAGSKPGAEKTTS